jgi:biotin operon repressor
MAASPYQTLPAARLANQTPPLSWMVEELFLEAGAGILGGAPKSGKTFLALDLCVAIASGTSCAGHFRVRRPGPVVLLCAEDPPALVSSRLRTLARGRNLALEELSIEVIVDEAVRLPEGLARLEATLERFQPRLLLLDPLIRLHRADENSASEMSVILDGLRRLARTSGAAILLVHHARKAAAGNAGTALRGSSDLHAFGDSNLYLKRGAQSTTLELKVEHRAAASPNPIHLKLVANETTAGFVVADQGQDTADDPAAPRILALLGQAKEPLSSAALRQKLGLRNQTVARSLKGLLDHGLIHRAGRDGWAMPATPAP